MQADAQGSVASPVGQANMSESSTEHRRASSSRLIWRRNLLPCGRNAQIVDELISQLQSEVDKITERAGWKSDIEQRERLAELQNIWVECTILKDEIDQTTSCSDWRRLIGKVHRARVAELRDRTKKVMENKSTRHDNDINQSDDHRLPSSEILVLSKSSKRAAVQILEALEDEKVNLIGLVGTRGVGMTTLARQVGRKVRESYLFDQVVMVRAQRSQGFELDLENISQQMAKQGLMQMLQERKKILVILDDVWWKKPDLKAIGLLGDDHHKGCKILLTTCLPQVCTRIGCDRTIKLEGLTTEEVDILMKRADKDNRFLFSMSKNFKRLRDKIAGASEGLPFTIQTAMKTLLQNKDFSSESLRERLRFIGGLMENVDKAVLEYLQLYYHYLSEHEAKSFFILSSSFPKDYYSPSVEELMRYGIGQQVLENAGSIEEVRSRAHVLISDLQANSFLEVEKDGVKMPDLFRKLAHWIAKEDNRGMFLRTSQLAKDNLKSSKPEALTITMDTDDKIFKCPSSFLDGMGELKVLNLRGSCSSSPLLSVSLEALKLGTNLRTLLLSCFKLSKADLSSLGKLTSLKILCFHGCDIEELPDELGELHGLRLLDLSDCLRLPTFASNLLPRLSNLEELYISTADTNFSEEIIDSILRQICSLSNLTVLSVKVHLRHCPRDFVLPELRRYRIEINTEGGEFSRQTQNTPSRVLGVKEWFMLNAFKNLFPAVEHLFLDGIKECPNVVPNVDPSGLNALKDLKLGHCEEMECLVDMTNYEVTEIAVARSSVLQMLTNLELEELPSLICLWKGDGLVGFGNLKVIRVKNCRGLTGSLFPPPVAQGLKQLEILEIEYCFWLSDITRESSPGCLPKLSTIKIDYCWGLKYVFLGSMIEGLARLTDVEISNCWILEHVFWTSDQVGNIKNNHGTFELACLQRMVLKNLRSLLSICQGRDIMVAPSLEEFKVEDSYKLKPFVLTLGEEKNIGLEEEKACKKSIRPQLKVLELSSVDPFVPCSEEVISALRERSGRLSRLIVANYEELFDHQGDYFFSNLKELKISEAYQLRTLWKNGQGVETLQNLVRLELSFLPQLRHIFTPLRVQNVPQLRYLCIEGCDKLDQIIRDDQTSLSTATAGAAEAHQQIQYRPVYFPNLVEISILNCPELKSVFPIGFAQFPKLKSFKVEGAYSLRQIFAPNKQGGLKSHEYLELSRLQELSLINLPSFISFSPMGYRFAFPSLSSLIIEGCPQRETSFVTESVPCVYAETEGYSSTDASLTSQTSIPLPIFSGRDYELWHVRMRTHFLSLGLWEIVKDGIDGFSLNEYYKKKDAQALSIIQQALTDPICNMIIEAKSAKHAWTILQKNFQDNEELGDIHWKCQAKASPVYYPKDLVEELFVED